MKEALFCLCAILLAGCGGRSNTDGSQPPSLVGDPLTREAEATCAAYTKAVRAGRETPRDEIPPACWTDGLRQLKPLKVYTHRVNVVVVQRITQRTEEGKYVYIPISSYLPQSGDDGFVFSPNPMSGNRYTLGSGVFDFQRTRGEARPSQPGGP